MKRLTVSPRENWQARMEEIGFTFHTPESIYWCEEAYYEFSSGQIDELEAVTDELHELCLDAVDYVIEKNLFRQIGIDEAGADLVRESWNSDAPSLYGRFDLVYDNRKAVKLLEYNADTPTSLLETAVAQWVWLQDRFPEMDQFNSVHEKLLNTFEAMAAARSPEEPFYFASVRDNEEDFVTVEYLRDLACQAGFDGRHIFMEDIGTCSGTKYFYDLEDCEMHLLFKLYPWEWLLEEGFGDHLPETHLEIFEPPWKMVLSNKAILPILWELHPDHPNLLPAFFEPHRLSGRYVRKPFFSREGANVLLVDRTKNYREETGGSYGREGYMYQALAEVESFGGSYAVIGSWVVDGASAGIGIREDDSPITKNSSRFVPHLFRP